LVLEIKVYVVLLVSLLTLLPHTYINQGMMLVPNQLVENEYYRMEFSRLGNET